MVSGTSVLSCVELFAPARQTGASGFAIFPYCGPGAPNGSRPRRIGRPYVISSQDPPRYTGPSAPGSYLPPTCAAAVPDGLAGFPPCADADVPKANPSANTVITVCFITLPSVLYAL